MVRARAIGNTRVRRELRTGCGRERGRRREKPVPGRERRVDCAGAPGDGGESVERGGRESSAEEEDGETETRTVLRFERKGEGWAEEILPRVRIVETQVQPRRRRTKRIVRKGRESIAGGREHERGGSSVLNSASTSGSTLSYGGTDKYLEKSTDSLQFFRYGSGRASGTGVGSASGDEEGDAVKNAIGDIRGRVGCEIGGSDRVRERERGIRSGAKTLESELILSNEDSVKVFEFLTEVLRMKDDEAESVLVRSSSWRVTAKGRPLMDRQKIARVRKNMNAVVRLLVQCITVAEELLSNEEEQQWLLDEIRARDRFASLMRAAGSLRLENVPTAPPFLLGSPLGEAPRHVVAERRRERVVRIINRFPNCLDSDLTGEHKYGALSFGPKLLIVAAYHEVFGTYIVPSGGNLTFLGRKRPEGLMHVIRAPKNWGAVSGTLTRTARAMGAARHGDDEKGVGGEAVDGSSEDDVDEESEPESKTLIRWVKREIWRYRNKYTSEKEAAMLDAIDWNAFLEYWSPQGWEEMFDELLEWSLIMPDERRPPDHPIETWLRVQAHRKYFNMLTDEHCRRIESLGVDLSAYMRAGIDAAISGQVCMVDPLWMQHYLSVRHYREEHGHSLLPVGMASLRSWLRAERQRYNSGGMEPIYERLLRDARLLSPPPADRKARAAALRAEVWRARIDQLQRLVADGHVCDDFANLAENEAQDAHAGLRRWLRRVRANAWGTALEGSGANANGGDSGAESKLGVLRTDVPHKKARMYK